MRASLTTGLVTFAALLILLQGVPGAGERDGATAGDVIFFYQDLAWSPDGTRLAISALELPRERWTRESWGAFEGGHYDIEVMHADGSQRRRLIPTPGDDRAPAWSPDGMKIAYSSGRKGEAAIHIMENGERRRERPTSGRHRRA